MTVLSTLCRLSRISNAVAEKAFLVKQGNALKQAVRKMGGGGHDRTIEITTTRYQYTRFKDDLHFYVSIAAIPLGLLILYINIFTGPATLSEIPEDYEPKHWEYFKHPISRFISKNFHDDPQINYEKVLHFVWEEQEKAHWSDTVRKAQNLMADRDDYKAWYFIPSEQGRAVRRGREETDKLFEMKGYR